MNGSGRVVKRPRANRRFALGQRHGTTGIWRSMLPSTAVEAEYHVSGYSYVSYTAQYLILNDTYRPPAHLRTPPPARAAPPPLKEEK